MAFGAEHSEALDSLVAAFDPRSPSFRSNPYPTYHSLRCRSPIHYRAHRNDWILTRYDEIAALAKDVRLCGLPMVDALPAGGDDPMVGATPAGVSRLPNLIQESQALPPLWLVNRNPPDHTHLRKLLQRRFSPGYVARLRTRVEALANAHLDALEARGGMDIVGDLSRPLAFAVIADVLGIPEAPPGAPPPAAGEATFLIDLDPTAAARQRGFLGIMGLMHSFRRVVAAWERHEVDRHDGLIGVLAQSQAEGQVSAVEVLAQSSFTLIAGHSTTEHLIGNGVLALLRHPDQLQLLRGQPVLIERAVEELLRYDTPAQVLERLAVADITIAGKTICKGQWVHLVLGAANRDPAVFPDPDRLDLARDPNPHLSFGYGIHYCLGAALAKLTAQIAIGALLRRVPRFSLQADTVEWGDNYLMHGPKSLPVVFE